MEMIAIVDYGVGNLRSVQKGLEKVGFNSIITSDPDTVLTASGVILPGVGAFRDAMARLEETGLAPVLIDVIRRNRPFLGICLGMQLLFEIGEEDGRHQGLGVFPGEVKRLPNGFKVPHMGWNQLEYRRKGSILHGIPEQSAFYFVHSYVVYPGDEQLVLATASYGVDCPAVINRGYVCGVQFHPEKSGRLGLELLRNFGGMVMEYAGHPGH